MLGASISLMLCRCERDNRLSGVETDVVVLLTTASSSNVSGLKRTRLCDDIDPSFALKYELSSLVKLSDGVVLVGLFLCGTALLPPNRGLGLEYFRILERNFAFAAISNGKLSGRSK